MRKLAKGALVFTAVLLAGLVAAVAGIGIDIASASGEVPRNVFVDGYDVSGYGQRDLDRVLRLVESNHAGDLVIVQVEGLIIESTHGPAGIGLDRDAIKQAALNARTSPAGLADRVAEWRDSFEQHIDIPISFTFDPGPIEEMVASHPDRIRSLPIEPFFSGFDGPWAFQPPIDGAQLLPGVVSAALGDAVAENQRPFQVTVEWTPIPTKVSQAQFVTAFALADQISDRVTIEVNGQTGIIGAESVRRWIESVVVNDEIFPIFDDVRVEATVERLFEPYADEPTEPSFTLEDGEVVFDLGEPALRCCGPGIADLLWAAVNESNTSAVVLPTTLLEEDLGLARAEAYGISEKVAEFTTRHSCCASRVTNIQRIADIVRGYIIAPGESLSINEFVGFRTRAKGFVTAGVIKAGYFDEDVGGGISQFATTTFNAAFFAGLDIPQYRAHSVYISRYPYGREATLNFPQPDLEIENNTPYHVMIWTSYTGSSITVSVYSTPYFEVEQSGQFTTLVGLCKSVTTLRRRTHPDGNVIDDRFFAFYRPGDGLDCNGKPIPRN